MNKYFNVKLYTHNTHYAYTSHIKHRFQDRGIVLGTSRSEANSLDDCR